MSKYSVSMISGKRFGPFLHTENMAIVPAFHLTKPSEPAALAAS